MFLLLCCLYCVCFSFPSGRPHSSWEKKLCIVPLLVLLCPHPTSSCMTKRIQHYAYIWEKQGERHEIGKSMSRLLQVFDYSWWIQNIIERYITHQKNKHNFASVFLHFHVLVPICDLVKILALSHSNTESK